MDGRYALFGHPVAHSRSPGIYASFRDGFRFELIDVEPGHLADAVQAFGHEGGRGANLTLPYKLEAATLADSLSKRARLAGAVNLLRFETDGILFGDNTDGAGLLADLVTNHGLELAGKRILVIGAGGAARGIIGPLLSSSPDSVVVTNRTQDKAEAVAGRFTALGRVRAAPLGSPGKAFDLVINATSCSLSGELPALPPGVFAGHGFAYDLAYGDDGHTVFTRWALENGAAGAADGWGMLVEQAAESWLAWFGNRPDTVTASTETAGARGRYNHK